MAMDEFDRLADLEAEIYRQGALTGSLLGRQEGFAEGESLGHSKGFALASEIGFYLGSLDSVLHLCTALEQGSPASTSSNTDSESLPAEPPKQILSDKIRKTMDSLRNLALKLNEDGVLKADVTDELHNIRSKFKLICTQLGLKIRFTGTTVDKLAEDQIPAGLPSVEF